MSKLREQNMPSEDLSDLGAPAKPRGAGLADLVGESSVAAPHPRPAEGDGHEDQGAIPTPIRSIGAVRDVDGSDDSRSGRKPGRPRTRVRPVTAVYVSPGVKQRFEAYRHKHKLTNLQVVLKAISSMHDELDQVIGAATFNTAPVDPLFPADSTAVRYVGGGSVQIGFSPTPEQEEVIDRIGRQIGFDTRSTWIAPVLNAFLPGKKDAAPSKG